MERVQSERRFIQRRCRESKSVGVLAVGNIRRAHLDVGEEGVRVLRRHILCERAWDGARVAPMLRRTAGTRAPTQDGAPRRPARYILSNRHANGRNGCAFRSKTKYFFAARPGRSLQNPTLRPLAERSRQGLTPVQPPY